MAVVDTKVYDNSSTAVKDGFKVMGANVKCLVAPFTITSGNSIGSVFRLGQIPSSAIIITGTINNGAITGVTDADLGFYNTAENGSAVVDKDYLVDGMTLQTAHELGSELSAISSMDFVNLGKPVSELLSDKASEFHTYDLCITINTAASATEYGLVKLWYIDGAH